jgi:hypothetical protein
MLVCDPATVISRPQLSRTRYEAAPGAASHARETLHDVLPVDRKFAGFAGAFFPDTASEGESGDPARVALGSVASWHAEATMRIDPVREHDNNCRRFAGMAASVECRTLTAGRAIDNKSAVTVRPVTVNGSGDIARGRRR